MRREGDKEKEASVRENKTRRPTQIETRQDRDTERKRYRDNERKIEEEIRET